MKYRMILACAAALASASTAWPAQPLPAPVEATSEQLFVESHDGPRTRAEVREELRLARASGTMTLAGDIGDSQEVIEARQVFGELQREVMERNREILASEDTDGYFLILYTR